MYFERVHISLQNGDASDRHRRDRLQWHDRHNNCPDKARLADASFFQMNPGLHCPIVMVRSGSTDVGMNITLAVAFFNGIALAGAGEGGGLFHDGLGRNNL